MNQNYTLIAQKHIKDYNCEAYYLIHNLSGARIVKFKGDYPNKTFCIAFKTMPYDDSGVAHILEHSVLNGSKKYPVKSPFDELLKGSLFTFLNAMTADYFTMYPCASTNLKDYFNLMDVYLDAVFNPRIYTDNRILKQEGWRIVMDDENSMPHYTGVVYNEMKGVFSDPQNLMYNFMMKELFPDNCFSNCSGGDPEKIPTLTQEAFVEFHKKYYHPENSFVYFFGDADMEQELDFLDKNYLSKYTKRGLNYEIENQKPFSLPKTIEKFYPSLYDDSTYLSYNFVTCNNNQTEDVFGLFVLGEILVGQESGIIRQSFVKEGFGDEISFNIEPLQQTILSFTAYGCKGNVSEKFKKLIIDSLNKTVETGIANHLIEAVMNRFEFSQKEFADSQLGIKIISGALYTWFTGGDPLKVIEFDELRKVITSDFLIGLIKKYLLENNHNLLLTLSPKQQSKDEIQGKEQEELMKQFSSWDKNKIKELVEENIQLESFMNTPNSPEALKCIPHLKKEDLKKEAKDYQVKIKDNILRYEAFTNSIVYAVFEFNLQALPFDMLCYAGLLAEVLDNMSTEKYNYAEFDNNQDLYTGSFSSSTSVIHKVNKQSKREIMASFNIKTKFLAKNIDKVFLLVDQMVNHHVLNDKTRLKELVTRCNRQNKNALDSDPFSAVKSRVDSYFMEDDYVNEFLDGFDFYFFIKDLDENFDKKIDSVIQKLNLTANLLFNKDNVKIMTTIQKEDYPIFETKCKEFVEKLNPQKTTLHNWEIKLKVKNEAFVSDTKVQYVLLASDALKKGFKYNGYVNVLKKILSNDYLQNNVRVKGGAYGSWFSFTDGGLLCFSSYRDPNLKETLEIYKKSVDYLENFNADDEQMLKYIIGAIASEDYPLTARQEGNEAFTRYFREEVFSEIQQQRNEILSCKVQDIRNFATIIKDIISSGGLCVFGNKEKILSNKDLFKSIITL